MVGQSENIIFIVMKIILLLAIIFSIHSLYAQPLGHFRLVDMPEAVSNNAVCGDADIKQVYSFGGIDSTKLFSGIHGKVFKHTSGIGWQFLGTWPDSLGKIAASATIIKNKIYVIGGYSVSSSGNEVSSNKVHIFDMATDSFLADGAPIPLPIDDHVHVSYMDSLIYIITGWSNTTNVNNVQIYNPALNQWTVGTPVPNNNFYKAFGANGNINGNTIYYVGGASLGINFPIAPFLRKGEINHMDPTNITWSYTTDVNAGIYRGAMWGNQNLLVGGSKRTYNYNGLAYAGGVGVNPIDSATTNYINGGSISNYFAPSFPEVMDLRGVASGQHSYIIAGGMEVNQKVSKRVYFGRFFMNAVELKSIEHKIYYAEKFVQIDVAEPCNIKLYDLQGRLLETSYNTKSLKINNNKYQLGMYHILLENGKNISTAKLILMH